MAHFKFFEPAKTVINTFCRTTPGFTVYIFCIAVGMLSWAQGVYILLSPLYAEFSTFAWTLFTMLSMDFQAIQVFHDLKDGYMH